MPSKIAKTAVKKEVIKKPAVKVSAPKKAVTKPAAKTEVKVSSTGKLSAPVFDTKGAKAGTVALPKEIFGGKINQPLMAQAVRVYLANQRQGNATTQTRGEVTGSTKKIYRQKGTGNARHGGKRAPIFVKGGVAHGPKLKDFSLSFPKKMRKAALISALSMRASEGEIKVLSGLTKLEPKTKLMNKLIVKVSESKSKRNTILLVTSDVPKKLPNIYRAGRNIENVQITSASLLNTYEVLKYKNLLFMKESLEVLGGAK